VAGGQGEGGGPRQLKTPWGVAVAPNGDVLVADTFNHRVQRCPTSGSGDCGTVAGVQGEGNGLQQLDRPFGVAVAPNGDFLVVDLGNHRIQRCPGSGSGDCSTVAGGQGDGDGPQQLAYPSDVAMAPNGDFIVVDKNNHRVQLCPISGSRTCRTVAGGQGPGKGNQQLHYPMDIAVAPNGDFIVADQYNHRVQRCPGGGSGDCSTVAGRQGHGTGPQQLFYPTGVAVAPSGDFVVADKSNNRVQLCPASGSGDCSTVVGGSYYPKDVALILEA